MKYTLSYMNEVHGPWIDDCLSKWNMETGSLTYASFENSVLDPYGIVCSAECMDQDFQNEKKIIYLGVFRNIWGHCITDNLSRIWFLKTLAAKELQEQGFILACHLEKDSKFSSSFVLLLQYLGVDSSRIKILAQTKQYFSNIVIPDKCFTDDKKYFIEFKNTIDTIREKIPVVENSPSKIYFSRTKVGRGRDFGEKSIEKIFAKLGYHIFYPEEIPLNKQLELLKNCESFASTEGSVSHNVMFCKDGVENVVVSKMQSCMGYQFSAMHMRNAKVVYIDSFLSLYYVFAAWTGPFFMYVNDCMVKFAKDRGAMIQKNFSVTLFLKYFFKCVWLSVRYRTKIHVTSKSDFYQAQLINEVKQKLSFKTFN